MKLKLRYVCLKRIDALLRLYFNNFLQDLENHYEIDFHDEKSLLGQGTYGYVYVGFRKATHKQCAIKAIKNNADADEININDFRNEINILYNVKHSGIISLFDFFMDDVRV